MVVLLIGFVFKSNKMKTFIYGFATITLGSMFLYVMFHFVRGL